MEAHVRDLQCTDFLLDSDHVRALFEQSPDAIIVLGAWSRSVVAANRAAGEMLGYGAGALAGRSIDSLAHPGSRARDSIVWAGMACGFRLRDANVALVSRDQRKIEASVSTSSVCDWGGEAIARVAVFRDISRRRELEREMLANHGQLRALAYELSVAEERERKRIASGLHDEIGQVLAIAKLKLGELASYRKDTREVGIINDIRALMDEASRAARTATFELSCPVLQQLGLEAAIENLGSRMQRSSGLAFEFSSDGGDLPFPSETLAVLYRATRELLFNVDKHARASTVRVEMRCAGDRLSLDIKDDGAGFEPSETPMQLSPTGGFGLFSIAAQMQGIGGSLAIESEPGAGTRVTLRLPFDGAVTRNREGAL